MGMSTNLMASKMKMAAKEENYECDIVAHSLGNLKETAIGADCILIGPQVHYQLEKVQKEFPTITVREIGMEEYGQMNGEAVLRIAREAMGDV